MPFDDEHLDDGFAGETTGRVQLQLWKRMFGYAFAYKKEVAFLMIAAVVTAAVEIAYPLFTKWVVDDVQRNGMQASFGLWAGLYLACNLVMALTVGGFEWIAGRVNCHIGHDIRFEAFENLQKLSFSFFDRRPVGWLMARLTADCNRLTFILAWGFVDMIWGFTIMLGLAGAMLVMEWRLALLVMTVLPVVWWVSVKFQRRILDSARLVRSTNSEITGSFNESIMGVVTSKTFVSQDANAEQFGVLTSRMYRASVRNLVLAAVYLPLVLVVASVAVNLTLSVGGSFVYLGLIGAGTVVAFTMLCRNFFWPAEIMSSWFTEFQMAQAAAERVLSVIDAEPEIQDSASVRRTLAATRNSSEARLGRFAADGGRARIHRIELKGVGFAYDPEQPVLQGIDLVAERGETIAIVGPTGGGKSTLVNVICRFYEPSAGQVLIDGTDYRNRSLHWLQSNLGMVLQDAHVFSGSIRENIRYGRLNATGAEVEHAARLADAHHFISALEQGYDTPAGEGGSRLSAGQKQLVSLARAILADPQILVMDEATSSVDTETELAIQHGLTEIFKGRISFVIAHRLSTIRNATRILVIDGGRIAESGDHGQLMAANGRYAALYRHQGLNETTQRWGEIAERDPGGSAAT